MFSWKLEETRSGFLENQYIQNRKEVKA